MLPLMLLAAGVGLESLESSALGAPATIRVAYVSPAPTQPVEKDAAVIFRDDFDRATSPDSRYFEYESDKGSFVRSEGDGYGGRGAAMKAQFEKGQVGFSSLKVLFGRNPFDRGIRRQETFRDIYWRVYVKHEQGWHGNPAKLGRMTCLAGTDWSQGFIAHVWGGKDDCLAIDPATGITDNRRVTSTFNDFPHLRWLGILNGHTPIFSTAESGRWVCVESHVRLNSPGQRDGAFELWVDGQVEARHSDLDWHGTWSDYAINAVFIENYWNSGSVKRQARWFDDLVISTRPIGPITATGVPTITRTPGADVSEWEAQAAADPDGKDVVWAAGSTGTATSLTVDAARGRFSGTCSGKQGLAAGATYWLRLRERHGSGDWSAWTSWHAPFRTPAR